MHKKILIIFLLFLSVSTFAQESTKTLLAKSSDFSSVEKYDSALFYAQSALLLAEKEFGKNDSNYVNILYTVFELQMNNNRYDAAEKFILDFSQGAKDVFGAISPKYSMALDQLAGYYFGYGNYKKAIAYMKQREEIIKTIYGSNSLQYADYLNSLGVFYEDNANYTESETYFKNAINLSGKLVSTKHQYYINFTHNLADLYYTMARYPEAEPLFLKAIALGETLPDSLLPDYAMYFNNLARLYNSTGRYDEALPLFIKSYEMYQKQGNLNYLSPYSNAGSTYYLMGNYKEAEKYLLESSEKLKAIMGEMNGGYASDLRRLALVYQAEGKIELAEEMLKKVVDIYKNVVGEEHPFYAAALNSLGDLYFQTGRYSLAEELYKQSLNIRKNAEGINHPSYARSLMCLATLYFTTGEYQKARDYFSQNTNVHLNNIQKNFVYLSEFERGKYWATLQKDFDIFYSYAVKDKTIDPAITSDVFNKVVSTKGLLLHSSVNIKNSILTSNDTALINEYNRWISLKYDIGKYILLGQNKIKELGINIDSLNSIANVTEKDLSSKSQMFLKSSKNENITWQDIQKKLKKNEAVVEFFEYHSFNKKFTDSVMYCALIVRPGYIYPELVPLFEEKQLNEILNKMTSNRGVQMLEQPITIEKSRVLYDLIWCPIEAEMKGVKKIYISPSGLLNKVSFAALTNKDGKFLFDIYNLNFLANVDQIQLDDSGLMLQSSDNMALYGGIIYNMSIPNQLSQVNEYCPVNNPEILAYNAPVEMRNASRSEWYYLKGTLKEIENIQAELQKKNIAAKSILGEKAVEESFKSLSSKSPSIIHIATHGYFIPSQKTLKNNLTVDNELRNVENPLFRSGLIMAGANRAWKNDSIIKGVDDGILTAYEVSLLDLSKTKLVVLSACESGLGDIKGSEGVYGLQRAFKMAGVQYLIVTLWEIQDEVTVEFMTEFYRSWLSGVDIQSAFKSAQDKMRKKYEANYWAAFVLIK